VILGEVVCGTFEQLAEPDKVNRGNMSRVLRLTLSAPAIVEAILDGRQPEGKRLEGEALMARPRDGIKVHGVPSCFGREFG
jgi:hypothetical protein